MEPENSSYKRAKRISRPFTVRFRVRVEGDNADSVKWNIVTTKNLSSSGIYFSYNEKIAVGSEIEFNISLPFVAGSVHCLGKVCRVDEDKKYLAGLKKVPFYGIAAFFEIIDNDAKNAIDGFAENFSK